jgi:hypothetical protein
MPLCPKCANQIDHLINSRSAVVTRVMIKNPDGSANYLKEGEIIFMDPKVIDEYGCPVCSATLFTSEAEALAFLQVQERPLPYVR